MYFQEEEKNPSSYIRDNTLTVQTI